MTTTECCSPEATFDFVNQVWIVQTETSLVRFKVGVKYNGRVVADIDDAKKMALEILRQDSHLPE